ncbi:hypothetical protein GQ53DRAFT_405974 [Thozetella sp. PMI_491]|nr:hypothetical protein GQ53DRAFT_405974 [Thozetella sp. PMI_491]
MQTCGRFEEEKRSRSEGQNRDARCKVCKAWARIIMYMCQGSHSFHLETSREPVPGASAASLYVEETSMTAVLHGDQVGNPAKLLKGAPQSAVDSMVSRILMHPRDPHASLPRSARCLRGASCLMPSATKDVRAIYYCMYHKKQMPPTPTPVFPEDGLARASSTSRTPGLEARPAAFFVSHGFAFGRLGHGEL